MLHKKLFSVDKAPRVELSFSMEEPRKTDSVANALATNRSITNPAATSTMREEADPTSNDEVTATVTVKPVTQESTKKVERLPIVVN